MKEILHKIKLLPRVFKRCTFRNKIIIVILNDFMFLESKIFIFYCFSFTQMKINNKKIKCNESFYKFYTFKILNSFQICFLNLMFYALCIYNMRQLHKAYKYYYSIFFRRTIKNFLNFDSFYLSLLLKI